MKTYTVKSIYEMDLFELEAAKKTATPATLIAIDKLQDKCRAAARRERDRYQNIDVHGNRY
tara:strand:- start:182 stop:364 length:183 start_codon:yes stop_codon:yes gene_type:complete